MTTKEALQDIEGIVTDLEKKQEFCLDEWVAKTEEEFKVTDSVKCIECNKEKPQAEMQKIFHKRAGEGICRKCFFFYEEYGTSTIEYALMVMFIACVAVLGFELLGGSVKSLLEIANTLLPFGK